MKKTLELENYTPEQIKELVPVFLRLTKIDDLETLRNKFFIASMLENPRNEAFQFLKKYIELFGYEAYNRELEAYEENSREEKTLNFFNLVLEPKFRNERTEHVFESRKKAMEMYAESPEQFSVELYAEPENFHDEDAIAVYAVGKKEKYPLGYISKILNKDIKARLHVDQFPFIKTNIRKICTYYEEEAIILDITF